MIPSKVRIPQFALIMLVVGFVLQYLPAESTPDEMPNNLNASFAARVDWEKKELLIRVSAPVDRSADIRNRATLVSRKESELKDYFSTIFPLCLHRLRIDSQQVFRDLMVADSEFSLRVENMANFTILNMSLPAKDLKSVSLEYRLSFAPHIHELFDKSLTTQELPRLLAWQAAADYSGLIIYTEEKLPWYGTDQLVDLVPSLFPRLFDEDGRLILDLNHLDPAALRQQGTVSFRSTLDKTAYKIVGNKPLVVSARALFGQTPTDLMISREDANTLLFNEKSRQALRTGKIVVIVKPTILAQETLP